MCNVEYRKLDFDRYPPHIRNLHNYAFKALVWLVSIFIFFGGGTIRNYPNMLVIKLLHPFHSVSVNII